MPTSQDIVQSTETWAQLLAICACSIAVAIGCGDSSSSGTGGSGANGTGIGGSAVSCQSSSECDPDEHCTSDCDRALGEYEPGTCEAKPAGSFPCGGGVCSAAGEACIAQLTAGGCVPSHCEPLPPDCHTCECTVDVFCSGTCDDTEGNIFIQCDG